MIGAISSPQLFLPMSQRNTLIEQLITLIEQAQFSFSKIASSYSISTVEHLAITVKILKYDLRTYKIHTFLN